MLNCCHNYLVHCRPPGQSAIYILVVASSNDGNPGDAFEISEKVLAFATTQKDRYWVYQLFNTGSPTPYLKLSRLVDPAKWLKKSKFMLRYAFVEQF